MDKYLTKVDENDWLQDPELHPLRQELVELAREYYQQFIDERSDDPRFLTDLAMAYERMGEIALKLGHDEEGRDSYQKALGTRQKLAEEDPGNPELQHELAECYARISMAQQTHKDAKSYLGRAIKVAQPLLKPTHRSALGMYNFRLGLILLREFLNAGDTTHRDEAFVAAQTAEAIMQKLAQEHPQVPEYQENLSEVYTLQAGMYDTTGNGAEARSLRRQCREIREQLADQDPDNETYQYLLGNAYYNLEEYRKAVRIYKRLAEEHSQDENYQDALRDVYRRVALQQEASDNLAESIAYHQASLDVARKLVENYPRHQGHQSSLAVGLDYLGQAQREAGMLDEAISSHQSAIAILEEHAPYVRGRIADAYMNLSKAHEDAGQLEEAIASIQDAVEVSQQLVEAAPKQLRFRAGTSGKLLLMAKLKRKLGRPEDALTLCQEARELLEDGFVDGEPPDAPPDHVEMAKHVRADILSYTASLEAEELQPVESAQEVRN